MSERIASTLAPSCWAAQCFGLSAGENDPGALVGKRAGGRKTNPAIAADDDDLGLKSLPHAHFPPLFHYGEADALWGCGTTRLQSMILC